MLSTGRGASWVFSKAIKYILEKACICALDVGALMVDCDGSDCDGSDCDGSETAVSSDFVETQAVAKKTKQRIAFW